MIRQRVTEHVALMTTPAPIQLRPFARVKKQGVIRDSTRGLVPAVYESLVDTSRQGAYRIASSSTPVVLAGEV